MIQGLFRKLFSYSRKEKNGILVLVVLIIMLSAFNLSAPLFKDNETIDFSEWQEQVENFYASSQKFSQNEKNKIFHKSSDEIKRDVPYESGTTGNVKKVDKKPVRRYPVKSIPEVIELNSADSAKLESLPGLGPVLSARIIKYRTLLGGFHSLEQLKEVYGLKDEFLSKALPYISIDSNDIEKLRINFLSKSELAKHPYISFRYADSIVKLRSETGKIGRIEEISGIISDKDLKKVEPYLSFK
jgi:DNA uptake protein ComE-like DNA-binding protein